MVGVFKSGSKWGPHTAFVLPLFSCNLWVPVFLFFPFVEDSALFIIFSATGFDSGWGSLPRFVISSTGFKRQWYSKFIVSSLAINWNFSKKITFASSITLCSPRYCLQRKGRKKCGVPSFASFQNIELSSEHSLKVTNFLVLLQIHRITTHLMCFNYLCIHFLIFKLSHLSLVEVC